jgi:hypothetical protein
MHYRRSWNYRIPTRAGRGILIQVAAKSFIEAGSSLCARADYLPKDRVPSGALPLQTVYDLAAKTEFSIRFDFLQVESFLYACHGSKLNQPAKVEMTQPVEPA